MVYLSCEEFYMAKSRPKLREILDFVNIIRKSASHSAEDESDVVVDLLVAALYEVDDRSRQRILDKMAEDYGIEAPHVYDHPELPF